MVYSFFVFFWNSRGSSLLCGASLRIFLNKFKIISLQKLQTTKVNVVAKAVAVAVADVEIAKASQELLSSKIEGGLIKLQYASCKIFYIFVNTPNFR